MERISTVGCSLSLAGVTLTILAHVLQWKKIHRNARSKVPSKVLMNLCVANGITNVLAILEGPARDQEVGIPLLPILFTVFNFLFPDVPIKPTFDFPSLLIFLLLLVILHNRFHFLILFCTRSIWMDVM